MHGRDDGRRFGGRAVLVVVEPQASAATLGRVHGRGQLTCQLSLVGARRVPTALPAALPAMALLVHAA